MHDVEEDEDQCLEELDLVSDQEIGDDSQVYKDEDGFTCDNPPVNQCASVHNQVNSAPRATIVHVVANGDARSRLRAELL